MPAVGEVSANGQREGLVEGVDTGQKVVEGVYADVEALCAAACGRPGVFTIY